MPKQKRNWNQLKQEFMETELDVSVSAFLVSKWVPNNSRSRLNTKGRTKERKEVKKKVMKVAIDKSIVKQAKALEIPMDELMLSKKEAVSKVMQQVLEKDLDIQDLERTIKILRTELGLPTSYSKNENMNTEKIEGIHIIMGKNLIDKKENDKNNV